MNQKITIGLVASLCMAALPAAGQNVTPIASVLEWNDTLNRLNLQGQQVKVAGVVLAEPALEESLGEQKYILYDHTGALRIFNPRGTYEPKTGDSVSITGTVVLQAGLAALGQKNMEVQGQTRLPALSKTSRCDSAQLYHLVQIAGVYLEDVKRWSQQYQVHVIAGADTLPVYGSQYGSVPATYGRFTIRGVCGRTKGNTGGYTYHLTLVDSQHAIVSDSTPAIRFQDNRTRAFSNQTTAIPLVLDQPLKEDGWLKIRLSPSENVQYGPDGNYATTPAANNQGVLTLPIPKGMKQVDFKVSVNEHDPTTGDNHQVFAEIVETSPGLETVREAQALVKIH